MTWILILNDPWISDLLSEVSSANWQIFHNLFFLKFSHLEFELYALHRIKISI